MAPLSESDVDGPPTVAWKPVDDHGHHDLGMDEIDPTPGQGTPPVAPHEAGDVGPEEQALDEFFEDDDESGYLGERRFGGRLRRKR